MIVGSTVQIFRGGGRQPWYVRFVSANGQILTTSEGYVSKWNAKRAARRMFPDHAHSLVILDGPRTL